MFENVKRKNPLGLELIKKGLVTEQDVDRAILYQQDHPEKKLGEIFEILKIVEPQQLLEVIAEKLGEKPILLKPQNVRINYTDYLPLDVIRENKLLPYEIVDNIIRVAFSDPTNTKIVEEVRMQLINKGLILDKYVTFAANINRILEQSIQTAGRKIDPNQDITTLVDNIIIEAIEKRASDIHIEPNDEHVRIRYRIDGELITIGELDKGKQLQLIGRLKAISNMHQEKQESQDGRITNYDNYNIRVSSQKNIYGEKFVLRLLKKNNNVRNMFELGFPNDPILIDKAFNKRNSIVIVCAPTGEGKTTTLYSVVNYLNKPNINITTIEDPVEVRMPGLNQIEVDSNTRFSDSLRTVLRQDPDVILVGEIRDKETANIAIESGHTGHYVLSTIHTIDAVEIITRLRKLGVSSYDIASTFATGISQRLVRKICTSCCVSREFNKQEIDWINDVSKLYNVSFDLVGKTTFDAKGCDKCNKTGYFDRIALIEVLLVNDDIREMISSEVSSINIKKYALEHTSYKPLVVDGVKKVLQGITTVEELKRKIIIEKQ